ncbi:hypothetical protein [Bifidobacterium magnum]|uniref:Uncharacterized protein n=1 Tax=Bifidobacterium magnum TaxID=1692 RepID=A0A087B689_9BIFI|nr:hypothetical protein [Bifidobacterium magnum]KFI66539.1 hypothetical protein BMAGN_1447 [Bifidobacterium magnum]
MAVNVDQIDWVEWMRIYALDDPDLFTERYPVEWVCAMCRIASRMALTEAFEAQTRLDDGTLSEETFAYVCCMMVLRVVRYRRFKSESNGTYTYTNADPLPNDPGKDASPNLYLSKREKTLLQGYLDGHGPMGTVHTGLDRMYGM